MKKVIFSIILFFLMAPTVMLIPSAVSAQALPRQNCEIASIPSNSTDTETCFNLIKEPALPLDCQKTALGLGQTCCCSQRAHIYTCSWRKVDTQTEANGDLVSITEVGGCFLNEKAGSDCSASAKPAGDYYTKYECCCPQAEQFNTKANFTLPQFQIPIDTIKLTAATCTGPDNTGACQIPWIAEYIKGIYNYGLGIGGILAAVVLMAGGVLWLVSAGDASKVSQAKDLIIGSVTGLIILLGTYIILDQINPELTSLKSISVNMIERITMEPDDEGTTAVALDLTGIERILGVKCSEVTSVSDLVYKSKGKTTYNNINRGKTGPNNTIYNDCSGFANFILKCALKVKADSQTASIFSDNIAWGGKTDDLIPGDLIGWPPSASQSSQGHVFIYMGDGIFGDCHGGEQGRKPGNCISSDLSAEDVKASAKRHSGGKLYFKRY